MRLLSFNIAHGRGLAPYQGLCSQARIQRQLEKIAGLILELDVDVVALQEVDQGSHWTRGIDFLAYLSEHTGLEHTHMGAHVDSATAKGKPLRYGNAVLSRHPVCNCSVKAFEANGLATKGFMFTELCIGERCVPLINLHLDHLSRKRRLEQVGQLIQFIDEQEVLPLICGDFNATHVRSGDAVRTLLEHVRSHGDYALFPEKQGTFPSIMPARRLDFVMVPPAFRARSSDVVRTLLSDHRPVFVELGVA